MKLTQMGSFEAKTHLSPLLDRVEKGERIEITRRGRAVARLVPVPRDTDGGAIQALIRSVREERGRYGVTTAEIDAWKKAGRR